MARTPDRSRAETCGMPGIATGRFIDPDNYAANMRGLDVELIVTHAGHFDGHLTGASLSHIDLLCAQEFLPRVGYISLRHVSFFAFFAMEAKAGLLHNGLALEPGDIALHSHGESFHQRMTAAHRWGMLAFAPQFIAVYAKALAGLDFPSLAAGRVVRTRSRDSMRLLRLHARIGRLVETRPLTIGHPEVARALEQEVVHALVTCLAGGEIRDPSRTRRHSAEIMTRLESVIAADPYRMLTAMELCSLVGVAQRTLWTCCNEFLGVSPGRYLRLRWLNIVRRALLRTDPATAQVGEIAKLHGVTEIGRFAEVYRKAFGESPSTTLRRVREASDPVDSPNLHSARLGRAAKVTS
jgi:AraC-like DNA-binding protein